MEASKIFLKPRSLGVARLKMGRLGENMLEKVLDAIKPDFCKIAIDQHGTRALQGLLEEFIKNGKKTPRTETLIHDGLSKGQVFNLICNISGNHVL